MSATCQPCGLTFDTAVELVEHVRTVEHGPPRTNEEEYDPHGGTKHRVYEEN